MNWPRISPARSCKKLPPGAPGGSFPGFSFVELMVVLVLLATIMFLAIPTFQNLLQNSLTREVNRLSGVVRLIRNQAILNHKVFRLVWDLEKGEYLVEERTAFAEFVELRQPKLLARHQLPSSFVLTEITVMGDKFTRLRQTVAPVHIDSSGFIDQFLVHFTESGKPWTLKVKGFSARISLEEGHVEFSDWDD